MIELRAVRKRFGEQIVLDGVDFTVADGETVALLGPSGTGKTHYLEGLASAAIDTGRRVAWFSLESLTATIGRARVDGSVARVVARICRSELIVVDDIGMLPAGQEAADNG